MSPPSVAYEATAPMHSIHSILEETTTPIPTSPQPSATGLGITTTTPEVTTPSTTTATTTTSSTSTTPTPCASKTALYQSYHSQIENLKRLPVPYSDIYHALSSYDTIPFSTLVERFQRAAADLSTWLETAEMAVFALAMDVGQEGASDKRDIGEIDVIMNRFHPNIEMLVELKERIESRIKDEVAAGNTAVASSEQDLQQTTQSIKSSWASLKQTLEKVKGDLAGSRLRSELLTHMDNVLNDIEDICASIDAYNLERSAITSDEEGFLPSRISTSQEDAKAKARSLETLAQLDSRIELLISRIDFLDNRVGSLPTDESGLGTESKDALQSRYQQVQLRWDDLKFRRERVSDELKEDKWLEVFEQVAEQVESMMESMERAIIHCQGLLDQIRGMVREKVVPDAPVDRDHLYSIFKSFEAKHKYYAPAVNKMLDMLENGIESRMTRNHDVIQRHQAMNLKWDQLQDGLDHVDRGLDGVERWLDILDASRLPYLPALPLKQVEKKPAPANGRRPVSAVQSPLQRQQQQKLQQQQQQQQTQRGRRPLPNSAASSPSPSPAPGRPGTRSPLSSGYGNYRAWSPASSNDGIAYQSMLTASSLNNYRSLSPSPTRSPTRNGRSRPWCPSVSVSSPGIPGFPQEISPAATYIPRPGTSTDVYRNDSPAPGPMSRASSSMSGTRSAAGTPSMLKSPVQYKPVFSPAGSRSKLSTGIQAPLNGTTPATRKTQLPQPASRTAHGAGAASPNRPGSRGYGREATSPIPSYGASPASSRLPTSASHHRQVSSNHQFGYSSHGPEGRSSPASPMQRGYYEERGQYGSRPGSATGSVSSVGRSAYSYRSYDEPASPSVSSTSSISSASRYHSQQHHQKSLPEMMEKLDIRIEDVEPYVPIQGEQLDEEFARVVNASPIQMKVQRLSEGKYYFGGRLQEQGSGMTLVGGKLVLCRLMVYGRLAGEDDSGVSSGGSHSGTDDGLQVPSSSRPKSSMGRRSGTSTPSGEEQKKPSKVLVRVGGGWQDLDIFLLDHSFLANESVVVRGY